ncbi:MAG: hypothetical protein WCJ09_29140 [Planctomycetota bacterium]
MKRSLLACLCALLLMTVAGCGASARTYPLNADLARSSVKEAMQAWVDGKSPKDLKPRIIVGDPEWEAGLKLESFEIIPNDELTDGSNLHLRVKRKLSSGGQFAESTVKYIVSTSPVITIFPQ